MKANRDHASFLYKARFSTAVNINTCDGIHDVWSQETSESMYIYRPLRFSCNVKNGSLSLACTLSSVQSLQCPYTYEHKQHISKKCNRIASISNSLIAAVVKRLRSISDRAVWHGFKKPSFLGFFKKPKKSEFRFFLGLKKNINLMSVEFYLYPTVGTVLIHSIKPELTE